MSTPFRWQQLHLQSRTQFLRAVSHSVGAHRSKLCDAPTDSDSDTSSDEEQPDADASTNAVIETVSTPDSDVYLVALSRLWHLANSVIVRPAQTTWNDPVHVFSDVQLRYVNSSLTSWLGWIWRYRFCAYYSTRFCMLSVRCYCILYRLMLLAGCFLLTLLV